MTDTRSPLMPVLLVDDELPILQVFQTALGLGGIDNTLLCDDSRRVEELVRTQSFCVILLDLWMPGRSGIELLEMLAREYPEIPVIVVTGANDLETAVKCMKMGAFDYLTKPVENSRLVSVVARAVEIRELRGEYAALCDSLASDRIENPEAFAGIITQNRSMKNLFQQSSAIARTQHPVLISGETGTGKELLAGTIHRLSQRPGKLVTVNIAGLDDNLFSDTLFGHLKGAYTGASGRRPGIIEQAVGGTLFLDEIGDLSLGSQTKLLRLIQQREYFPLGADTPMLTDARLIVATNHDLARSTSAGLFRKDLFYRLKTHHLRLPPLRERKDDLPLLLEHFLDKAARALDMKKPTPPPELLTLLRTYSFPGNIRELEAMVDDAVSRHRSHKLSMEAFKEAMQRDGQPLPGPQPGNGGSAGAASVQFPETLPTIEAVVDSLIDEALRRTDGNQTIAASLIGMSRTHLNRRLKRQRR